MKRVLVGMDGSGGSIDALVWAAQFARGCGAEVVAVAAFQRAQAELSPTDAEELRFNQERILATKRVKLVAEIAPVRALAIEGDPRHVLLQAAQAEDADLVVVGSVGARSGPGFLHLGSVAEYLAHNTTRPLAVIPAGARGPITQILLGVHGSASEQGSLLWTAEVAATLDVPVLAVSVRAADVLGDREAQRMESRIREWTEPIGRAGVEPTCITVAGAPPADGLRRAADRHRADVVVVGVPTVGVISRQRAGGTGIQLLHHATLPTVLIPAEWQVGADAMA